MGARCTGIDGWATRGHIDTFARDNLPPRAQWPEFRFDLPELRYRRPAQLRHQIPRPLGRGGRGRPALPDLAIGNAELRAALRAGEPHRQRADARSRAGARQSRAAARRQQSDDGRGLSRRAEGRRGGGGDHAAAARQGAELSDRQGQDRAGAVRRAARRRDGEDQGGRARSQAHRLLGRRPQRRPRIDDAAAGL